LGQQAAIIHKIAPQPFRDAKDPLAVGYLFEYLGIKEFTEFEDPFLMTGGAKVPAFAGKWQEVFMLAVITFDPGKTQAAAPCHPWHRCTSPSVDVEGRHSPGIYI
jgi:hypothetical protein